jgi:hypothetical protein
LFSDPEVPISWFGKSVAGHAQGVFGHDIANHVLVMHSEAGSSVVPLEGSDDQPFDKVDYEERNRPKTHRFHFSDKHIGIAVEPRDKSYDSLVTCFDVSCLTPAGASRIFRVEVLSLQLSPF